MTLPGENDIVRLLYGEIRHLACYLRHIAGYNQHISTYSISDAGEVINNSEILANCPSLVTLPR